MVAWHGKGQETTCQGNVIFVEWKERNKNPYRYLPADAVPRMIEHIRKQGTDCDAEKTIRYLLVCML